MSNSFYIAVLLFGLLGTGLVMQAALGTYRLTLGDIFQGLACAGLGVSILIDLIRVIRKRSQAEPQ